MKKYLIPFLIVTSLVTTCLLLSRNKAHPDGLLSYELDLETHPLQLYWCDDQGELLNSIGNLKRWLERQGKHLRFATNAGMFRTDYAPQGLFVQAGQVVTPLDTTTGTGNFYLKPNGVFYVTANQQAVVCATEVFTPDPGICYATQSGPMLVRDGKIHAAFHPKSLNKTIRNGVGILSNGHIVFVMSTKPINFYDFATYFKELGCQNALYLDGFVCRTYLPEKGWMQEDGNLGVMIAVVD